MHKLNIKEFFGDETIDDLKAESSSIVLKSRTNPNFTFLGTTFSDFETAQGNWLLKLLEAAGGDLEKIAIANEFRATMEPFMEVVCKQINVQAKHVKSVLISSGGTLTSAGGAIGQFEPVVVNSIKAGTSSGSLEANLKNEPKAMGVMITMVDIATGESKTWFTTIKHIIVIPHLTRGKEYSLAFAWVGTDSTLNYSDPISRFVAN